MNNTEKINRTDWLSYLDPEAYPLLMPHFTCLKQNLFLSNRQLTRLTESQSRFLLHCNGSSSFSQILNVHAIEVKDIIYLSKYLVWWPGPVNDYVNKFGKCQ